MNEVKEKNIPRHEDIYDQSIAYESELSKELETLSPQEFMAWLEGEAK